MALSIHTQIITPLLILLLLCFIPRSSSLSTITISETSNQTLICALVKSAATQQEEPSLNCTSFRSGARIPVSSTTPFSGIVSGDGFLCGLRTLPSTSSSSILCWRFSANGTDISYKRIYRGTSLSELEAGNSHICGLVGNTSRLVGWQWPGYDYNDISGSFTSIAVGGDFVCGLSGQGRISCFGDNGDSTSVTSSVPDGNYSKISAGSSHACALSSDNDLTCWGSSVGAAPPRTGGKFLSVALGDSRGCGLRTNETVVCWGQNDFSLPESLQDVYFTSIVAKRNVFCGVEKTNFSLYCWGDASFSPNSPVFEFVQPGPCVSTSLCPCGPLPGSGSTFCSAGYSICSQTCPESITTQSALAPRPSTAERGGRRSSNWNAKMTAFLVVGCIGSVAFLLVVGFCLFNYCHSSVSSRVHDSGPLDEIQAPSQGQPAGLSSGRARASLPSRASRKPELERRLSRLASMGNVGKLEEFTLHDLSEATNKFSDDRRIGSGSFGSVYRGTLEDGREVAIKRAEASSSSSCAIGTKRQEDKDNAFINELESLSRIHHKNLVQLLGFCEDSNELILVYENMSNGSVSEHLHNLDSSPLSSWPQRIKVALDAARGIEYLHEYAVPPIIHRDIKTSNILLDSRWIAKVSDFGLSLMGPEDEESHLSMRAAGTMGYMDPEYYRLQVLTTKSDVYSFGVVLLEMLSGHKAIHKNENGVPRNVVDLVMPYIFQNEIHRVLDRRVPPPTPFEIDAVSYVGYLAADCVALEGRDRPTMREVADSLQRALGACLVNPTSFSRSTTESSG